MRLLWIIALFSLMNPSGFMLLGQSPQRESSVVDWGQAQKDANSASASEKKKWRDLRSSMSSSEEINHTELPVLLVKEGEVRGAPDFGQQGKSYTAIYKLTDKSLSIMGSSTLLHRSPVSSGGRDGEYSFEVIEDGADLAFSRYGASYLIRITCVSPSDKDCQTPKFLMKVAKDLFVAGGKKQ